MDTYHNKVAKFQKVLDSKKNKEETKREMMKLLKDVDDSLFVTLAFKFNFMYGYHIGLTREQVYKTWETKEHFK